MNLRRLKVKSEPKKTKRPEDVEWHMKDGNVTSLYRMGDSHICNSMNMLNTKISNFKNDPDMINTYKRHSQLDKSMTNWTTSVKFFKQELKWRNENNVFIENTKTIRESIREAQISRRDIRPW